MKRNIQIMMGIVIGSLLPSILGAIYFWGIGSPLVFEMFKGWGLLFLIFMFSVLLVNMLTRKQGLMWIGGSLVISVIECVIWLRDHFIKPALEIREVVHLYIYILTAFVALDFFVWLILFRKGRMKYQ